MPLSVRKPVVAGAFYPEEPAKLKSLIKKLFKDGPGKSPYKQRKGSLPGLIAPHAGYMYSGRTAAYSYYELSKHSNNQFIILGPNHTGIGEPISILSYSSMNSPLGTVPVNKDLRRHVLKAMSIEPDFFAHYREHSIEVQLPFLQYLYPKLSVLPIVIGNVEFSELIKLGDVLAETDATIICSSDFTHHGVVYGYNPLKNVKAGLYNHDMKAINKIIKLDAKGFHKIGQDSSICGYKPITALLQAMKMRGVKAGRLLNYSTSAEVTKDYENVVAYASIVFK